MAESHSLFTALRITGHRGWVPGGWFPKRFACDSAGDSPLTCHHFGSESQRNGDANRARPRRTCAALEADRAGLQRKLSAPGQELETGGVASLVEIIGMMVDDMILI